MFDIVRELSPNSHRIERLLGAQAQQIADKTRGWYGPPLPIFGTPLVIGGDGEYRGVLRAGGFASLADYAVERYQRVVRGSMRRSRGELYGFTSLSDLISEATTGGKSQEFNYQKSGVAAPAVAASQSLWGVGTLPSAGSNMAAAPGGTVPTNSTTGALPFANPGGADTAHLTTWTGLSTVSGAVMLADQIWGANINHATTANTVTGTPSRYTGTAAAGNFLNGRVTTVLGATAHNITVTYVDQAGNTAEAAAAIAVRVSSAVQTTALTQPVWYIPLNAGDTGMRNVTSIALSAASTGNVDWCLYHPLAILPVMAVNIPFVLDGINSAFNLVKIETNACLTFLEYFKSAVTAATLGGMIKIVSG